MFFSVLCSSTSCLSASSMPLSMGRDTFQRESRLAGILSNIGRFFLLIASLRMATGLVFRTSTANTQSAGGASPRTRQFSNMLSDICETSALSLGFGESCLVTLPVKAGRFEIDVCGCLCRLNPVRATF